jgi:beta-ribofuranosylaminobenzene 5'-phosphate synthase
MDRLEINAPARLHFGLINPVIDERAWPGITKLEQPIRSFGGCGVMIDQPALQLDIQRANHWTGTGSQVERAIEFGKLVTQHLRSQQAYDIHIHSMAREHSGLGTGTSLGLAIAKLICQDHGIQKSAIELAPWVNRGARSAIGIHGSDRGGFLVDFGKLPTETITPTVQHYAVPHNWRFVLIHPKSAEHWHGDREKQAFAKMPSIAFNQIEALSRLILLGLIPAILNHDFQGFSRSLTEYNACVGLPFRDIQGGIYTSPAIDRAVEHLSKLGIEGAGQSSWGPTIFALVQDQDHGNWLQRQLSGSEFEFLTIAKPV